MILNLGWNGNPKHIVYCFNSTSIHSNHQFAAGYQTESKSSCLACSKIWSTKPKDLLTSFDGENHCLPPETANEDGIDKLGNHTIKK